MEWISLMEIDEIFDLAFPDDRKDLKKYVEYVEYVELLKEEEEEKQLKLSDNEKIKNQILMKITVFYSMKLYVMKL